MVGQNIGYKTHSVSITEHATSQAKSGIHIIQGEEGTFWAAHESGAMMRIPKFHLVPPAASEVRQVLWRGRAAIASYLLEPDEIHPANAWLYICTDRSYGLDKLSPTARRNVRRGLKELLIAPLTSEQLLAHGEQAFFDTRRRNGLIDGTPEEFRRWFTSLAKMQEVVYLGAWKDNQLVAFLSTTEVDDWAEIGCFSMNALLQYRPNDTLLYSALSYYLVERGCRVVSYGLSSMQAESNAAGLHRFKIKIGFEAHPVCRVFAPHPLLRPFVNRLTLCSVDTALRFWPGERHLKKASGVLACMLGLTLPLEVAEGGTKDE